jgi:co-chaperonin GroES (HSP10)
MAFPVEANEDRLILRLIARPDKIGAFHVPDIAKTPPSKGIVLAVGPGNACKHCSLPKQNPPSIGDAVVFPETAGYDYDFEFTEEEAKIAGDPVGTMYKIIRFSDVMTIKRNNQS